MAGSGVVVRGGLIWYVAGVLSTLIVINDWFGQLFGFIAKLLSGTVHFIVALGGLGFVGLLILLGIGLFIGGRWTERARGAYDADNSWNARNNYRDG